MLGNDVIAFSAILKLATRRIGEDLFFRGFRSVLGMVFHDTFRLALGNIAIVISIAELATYLARVGYNSYREFTRKALPLETTYKIKSTNSGLIVANNTNIVSLKDFPILLPPAVKLPQSNFSVTSTDPVWNVSLRSIDSLEVFRSLHNFYTDRDIPFTCTKCANAIQIFNGAQVGHLVSCIRNPNRFSQWCDECLTDLTQNSHKPGCRRAILS